MYEISEETTIGAAHKLRRCPGEGERLHGHNWRVRATLRAKALDERGMVIDFAVLARELRALLEPWEHIYLNEVPPWTELEPTAENLAQVVADALASKLEDARVKVARVDVWETPTCKATYYRLP